MIEAYRNLRHPSSKKADAARFEFLFKPARIIPTEVYLRAVSEHWELSQWREWVDLQMEKENASLV